MSPHRKGQYPALQLRVFGEAPVEGDGVGLGAPGELHAALAVRDRRQVQVKGHS